MRTSLHPIAALVLAGAAFPFPARAAAAPPSDPARPVAARPAAAAQESVASPAADSDARFGAVPDFAFVERSGETVTRDDLLGQAWIAVPFFVRCLGPCPSLAGDLRTEVYERLRGTGVRIVSFSIDPRFDSPEQLADYAAGLGVEDDRWLFLTGEDGAVQDFVRDGLKCAVARDADEANPGLALTHSTRLPVIDPEGRIAGWYECADGTLGREGLEANLALLRARAWALKTPISPLPAINATLNGLATVLLLLGYAAIRRGRREAHARFMVGAFLVSVAFLVGYVWYHARVLPLQGGPTPYHGAGALRVGYLVMLASHVILAAVNLPMVLRTLWLAHRGDWARHRAWARWTFPIWLYVSITGVLVYVVLYHGNPAP